MLNITPPVLLATRPRKIRGTPLAKNKLSPKVRARRDGRSVITGLIDGQHRSEVVRRFLTAAFVGLSGSDRRDRDVNSSGVPDPKPSGPR
jgi:hypothetical protein